MMSSATILAADTIEELAASLGLDNEHVATFAASIQRYNEMCAAGRDDDFGRFAEVLFSVEQGPFYAVEANVTAGSTMCTLGGLLTDGEQNVVDKDYEPIPGLYATGNTCGRRYGSEYITPIFGISLAMAIVLGRECGRSVATWLDGEVEKGAYVKVGA